MMTRVGDVRRRARVDRRRAARSSRVAAEPARRVEHLGAAAQLRQRASRSRAASAPSPSAATSRSRPTRSWVASSCEDPLARLAVDAELVEQLAVEVGVAEADRGVAQPGRVERARTSTSITSAVPSGAGRADQLDPGLEELAHLAALRADRAVGVRDVAEAQRRLGVGVARRDDQRAIGTVMSARSASSVAVLVEEAVGAAAAAPSPRASTSSYSIVGVATSP